MTLCHWLLLLAVGASLVSTGEDAADDPAPPPAPSTARAPAPVPPTTTTAVTTTVKPQLRGVACFAGLEYSFPGRDDNSSVIAEMGFNSSKAYPIYCDFKDTACTMVKFSILQPGFPFENIFLNKTCRQDCLEFDNLLKNDVRKIDVRNPADKTLVRILVNISAHHCCTGDLCNSEGTLNGSNKNHGDLLLSLPPISPSFASIYLAPSFLLIALLALLLISPSRH